MPISDPTFLLARDMTCLGCGCLCDDIELSIDASSEAAFHGCRQGRVWFEHETKAVAARHDHAPALIDGRVASYAEAIAEAGVRIKASRSALIRPVSISTEAASSLIYLADHIRAVVEPASSHPARLAAIQRVGEISATLGEVRDRAAFALIWGVDLDQDYPRFRERFLSDHFLPNREVLELHHDELLGGQTEFIATLRALVGGRAIENKRIENTSRVELSWLADKLVRTQRGAILYGPDLERNEPHAIAELFRLVRDLNSRARFVTIGLGGPENAGGIASALTWTAGAPSGVDFSQGYPRHLPGVAVERMARGEIDLVIQISGTHVQELDGEWLARPANSIVIGPGATVAGGPETSVIRIEAQTLGIEESGTVARMDGVMLPVNRILGSGFPAVLEVVRDLNARLCEEMSV